MKNLMRNFAAILAGFVLASALMMLVETINGKLLYPDLAKAAEGIRDREAMRALFASAPIGSLLVVIVGWFLGSLAGCWLCRKMMKIESKVPTPVLVLASLLILAGVANNLMMPPPVWFWIMGLLALAGGSYIGGINQSRSAT